MEVWQRQAAAAATYQGVEGGAADAAPLQDPYANWALASAWRAYQRSPGYGWREGDPRHVRIIARAPDLTALRAALAHEALKVSELYRSSLADGGQPVTLHFTATVDRSQLSILDQAPLKLRWELASPLREAMWSAQTDSSGRYGPQRGELAFKPTRDIPQPESAPAPVQRHAIRNALAVIDYGCPFLNPQWAGETGAGTRVAALWDQQSGPREPTAAGHVDWWQRPPATGYGRELSGASMSALRRHWLEGAANLDEERLYRGLGYLVDNDDARRRIFRATHGTHVLDLAAGHPDPLWRLGASEARDAAGRAPLVFVQLPTLTAADSSGASLSAQILDALRYVLHVCHPDDPLVVNISYGSFAGPHDGSSLIERAMAELLQSRPQLKIVLSAGNARRADCHARRVVQPDRSALLRLQLLAHDTTDTFVEGWYQPVKGAALRARVRNAGRAWSDWVQPGQQTVLKEAATGQALAMLQHLAPAAADTASTRAQWLLALAPTEHAVNDEGPLNQPGVWEIEIALQHDAAAEASAEERFARAQRAVTVDAWIERDDRSDRGVGGQACFIEPDLDDQMNTLGSLATTPGAVVVGGFRFSDSQPVAYSSLPEHAAMALDWAVCEEDADKPGLLATAVRAGETFRMGGTSAAAPVRARRLYNELVAQQQGTAAPLPDDFVRQGTVLPDGGS